MSGLISSDDCVGMSETPEGLPRQIEKALLIAYTRKWKVTANVNKCGVVVHNEDGESGKFSWKWGEEEVPVVDQYTYLGVDISKYCSRDAHTAK